MKNVKSTLFFASICLITFTGCTSKVQKTIENIKLGIKTETTTSAKYAAFSQKASAEGLDMIAKLFDAVSKSEAIHASNHVAVLKSYKLEMVHFVPKFNVRSTAENLQEAIDGETYEVDTMYPMFLQDAKSKRIKGVTIESLTWAYGTEKKHVAVFKKALEALKTKTEYNLPFEYLVCPVCGNTFDSANEPEICELCGTNKELFIKTK
jgi:rubrerythrin